MRETTATAAETIADWSETDARMMTRALELAARGIGQVSPGPLVGCVIVDLHGEIVGEGCYIYDLLKHAETFALEQAGARAFGATAYVSLEPHAHHGRTPPCTNALIAADIKRVVVPIEDPNPEVSGRGCEHLRSAGVEVSVGLLGREAERLNEKYLHYMHTGRPFVHLKLASSLDGKIASRSGDSRWITADQARARVHNLRHEYDAIMVGAGTVTADDPLLTDRSGLPRRRPLARIVLDERLTMSPDSQLAQAARQSPVIVFADAAMRAGSAARLESRGVEIIYACDPGRNLPCVMDELGKRSLQSLLVEGGATVAGNLIDAGLVNKVSFFIAPLIIGGRDAPSAVAGVGAERIADAMRLEEVAISQHGRDLEITGYPVKGEKKE